MKKLLRLVLALALALPLSVTAFAAGDDTSTGTDTTPQNTTINYGDTNQAGNTTVNYSVAPAYTVTIPASVTIDGTNNSNTVTVSAEGVKVAKGQQVVVKLTGINETTTNGSTTSDNEFKVKTAEGAELKYTVKDASGNTINKDGTVLTVASGQNNEKDENGNNLNTGASTGSVALTFALNDTVQYAGTYTGTVTFTVSVEEVPDNSGDGDTGITDNP